MIVRETDNKLILTYQTEHARLSGDLARAWASPIPYREHAIIAAERHDDGWAQWESRPQVSQSGRPVDFIRIDTNQHVELFSKSSNLVADEDEIAGLFVSLHGERLYSRPFTAGILPKLETATGPDLQVSIDFVNRERALQKELFTRTCVSESDADHVWQLLQVWDRISLYVAMFGTTHTRQLPGFEVIASAANLTVEPWPFGDEFQLCLNQIEIANRPYRSDDDLANAITEGKPVRTKLRFLAK